MKDQSDYILRLWRLLPLRSAGPEFSQIVELQGQEQRGHRPLVIRDGWSIFTCAKDSRMVWQEDCKPGASHVVFTETGELGAHVRDQDRGQPAGWHADRPDHE